MHAVRPPSLRAYSFCTLTRTFVPGGGVREKSAIQSGSLTLASGLNVRDHAITSLPKQHSPMTIPVPSAS